MSLKMRSPLKVVSKRKAKKILKHGSIRDKSLTEKQRGYFGHIAGGGAPTKYKFLESWPQPRIIRK